MAKQEEWPGFGKRVRQRLRELGYVRPDGSEDISAFTVKKGYIVTLFYKYLTHTTPSRENLIRLANDLGVTPAWLLFGEDVQHGHGPSRGKAPRRQGRRPAGSLVLALLCGAGSLLGWPGLASRGASAAPQPLPVAQLVEKLSLIRRWATGASAWSVQPMRCSA